MAKVIRFHELGGPEVLRLEEIAFEDPAPGELRLKVGAIGLNRLEVVYRSGGFEAPNKYPAALGSECAGTARCTIWRSMLAWFGRAPTLPYQTLDTAWAEPPAQG